MPQFIPVDYDPFDRPSTLAMIMPEPGQDPVPPGLPDVVRRVVGQGQGLPEATVPLDHLDQARRDLWQTEQEAAFGRVPRDEPLRGWLNQLREHAAEGWPKDQGSAAISAGQPPRATSISDVRLVPVDHDPFVFSGGNLLMPRLVPVDHDPFAS